MQITFTGLNKLEVGEALKQFTTEKLDRVIRHFDHIISIKVTFAVENKIRHIAEATIFGAKTEINAKAESEEDIYSAVDSLIGKLDRQIIKHKEKLKDHREHESRETE
jgi:ribosome hibernation promoting factor